MQPLKTPLPGTTMPHFTLVWTLCRLALTHPSEPVLQTVERLCVALEKAAEWRAARSLRALVATANDPRRAERPVAPTWPASNAAAGELTPDIRDELLRRALPMMEDACQDMRYFEDQGLTESMREWCESVKTALPKVAG